MSTLMAREGMLLQKSMNFREGPDMLSVFLVLPSHDSEYKESWDEVRERYTFSGHDSHIKSAGGKVKDQLLMYEGGRLSDNGRFYAGAVAFKEGARNEALQIQVYEKLEAGAWFDKGIFNLIEAQKESSDGISYHFILQPADFGRPDRDMVLVRERMLPARMKARVWSRANGRCEECGNESGLRFVAEHHDMGVNESNVRLLCALHRHEEPAGLLGN